LYKSANSLQVLSSRP